MRKRVFHNPVIGDKATLIKTSDDTRGEYTLMEVVVAPGGGNTPHIHETFSEKFTVIEGRLSVTLNGSVHHLDAGESATVPGRAPHCFNNNTKTPVKFLVEFRPAQPGFEKAIAIGYGLAADGLVTKRAMPKNLIYAAVLVALSGTSPTGFLNLLIPLFKVIALFSRKTELKLINKYC
jgi:mannose-6-phosphate isomerase-like protein (cupin superfamily)